MAVQQGKTLYSVGGSAKVEDNLPTEICISN